MSWAQLFLRAARFFGESSGLAFDFELSYSGGVKRDAALFPINPGPRSIGTVIVNPVLAWLWDLSEDSGDELENIEALSFGM